MGNKSSKKDKYKQSHTQIKSDGYTNIKMDKQYEHMERTRRERRQKQEGKEDEQLEKEDVGNRHNEERCRKRKCVPTGKKRKEIKIRLIFLKSL